MSRNWKKPGPGGALLYAVLAGMVGAVATSVARMEVEWNRERADAVKSLPDGGLIVVANHTSLADGVFLALAGRRLGRSLRLLGTAGIINAPILRIVFRALGFIAVFRKGPSPADALKPAADALRSGEAIALYPEGRITRNERFWPERAKTGAVRLAIDVGVPIVPLASVGAHQVVGRKRKLWSLARAVVRRPHVDMRVGEPFDARAFAGLDDRSAPSVTNDQVRTATDEMMRRLVALVSELRNEMAPDPIGVERAED